MKRYLPFAAAIALLVVWLDPLGLDAQDPTLEVRHVKVVAGDTWVSIARRVAPTASNAQLDTLALRIRDANGQPRLTAGRILVYDVADVPVPSTPAPSTRPPTTTGAPTTTQPPTTPPPPPTSAATTTTPPVGDVLFFEDFTGDSINDFTDRFDWSVVDLWRRSNGWQGHHNEMCETPDTERRLNHIWPVSNTDPGVEYWLCGPSGPASDHLMTSNGDNGTFGITAFTPNQSFTRATAPRVCWDVNTTISRGRRLWWEVQLVNARAIANNRSLASQGLMVGGVDFERGTAFIGYGRGVDGTMMKRAWPDDSLVFDYTEELVTIWQGQESRFHSPWVERFAPEDRATRWHHCLIDNLDGTVTFQAGRPQGWPGSVDGVYERTVPGSFPATYRPIFSAHNYNAGKDGTLSEQTWHWDNLLVGRSPGS